MAKIQMSVLPAGSAVVGSLDNGTYELPIKSITVDGDCQMNYVEYPDGFTKAHQGLQPADVAAKITNQVKGRYGANAVIKALPAALIEGAIIEIEVTNG